MICNNLTKDIVNDCTTSMVRGIYPKVWILPHTTGNVIFDTVDGAKVVRLAIPTSENSIFAIEGYKFGLNVASEAVTSDTFQNAYKHKLLGTIHVRDSKELDKLDCITVIVNDPNKGWCVYGAENGLRKVSQTVSSAENKGAYSFEFNSAEGQEESQSWYSYVPEIETVENLLSNFEYVTVQIGAGNVLQQTEEIIIDSDKTAYLIQPDNSIVESISSVISDSWDGNYNGNVTVLIPINNLNISINSGEFIGEWVCGLGGTFSCLNSKKMSGFTLLEKSGLYINDSTNVSNLICPKATEIHAMNCNLPASNIKSILDDAYTLYLSGALYGFISLAGNAAINLSDISEVHSISYGDIIIAMSAASWTITIETV